MRLIDKDNISFHCNYDGDCTGDIEDCKECGNYICDFRDIQEQPTAYDIGKVVSELKTDSSGKLYGSINSENYLIPVKRVIEIVKHGVVSDNVCKWKKSKDYPFSWLVGCDGCEVTHRQGDYCPRCGKKIKVVE